MLRKIFGASIIAVAAMFLIMLASSAFAVVVDDADDNGNGVPDWYEELYAKYKDLVPSDDVATAPAAAPVIRAASAAVNLTVKAMPDQERWSGESFPIWGNVMGGMSPYNFQLDFGDGTPVAVGPAANPRYIAVSHGFVLTPPVTRQIYTATLTVTDSTGASASVSVEVDVIERGLDPTADEPIEIRDLEVNMAIQDGLRWLYLQQQGNGSWAPGRDVVGVTAEVVLAYEVQGHFPTGDSIYASSVQMGLNFLFANAQVVTIGGQPAGNPDTDGDGNGVRFGYKGPPWNYPGEMYDTGLVLQAITSSLAPNMIVNVPGSSVNGWTYKDVAKDTADYINWAQNESGGGRGGWRYWANYGNSDNSVTQWPVLGLEAAEGIGAFSIPTPAFVKNELNIWVGAIQNVNGGSGYNVNWSWNNVGKTGALLIEFFFLGDDASSARVQSALTFITNKWTSDWEHFNRGDYYAMYSVMKGLRLLDIDTLPDGTDWYNVYAEKLVDGVDGIGEQQASGRWPKGGWDYTTVGELNTAWAVLILSPIVLPGLETTVAVDIKPQSCPNPLNVGSKGVLPVAILGTKDFDVTQVEPASVLLEGVTPLHWSLEDVATPFKGDKQDAYDCTTEGTDGFMDITLKFDTQEVVAALGDVQDGDVLILALTGKLKDEFGGTKIRGEDIVVIHKKGKGRKASALVAGPSFPNPGNPEVWIPYRIAQDVDVTITVYNSYGQVIRILNLGSKTAGAYLTKNKAAYWDGKNEHGEKVSSGIYFYNIKAGDFSAIRKMVILK